MNKKKNGDEASIKWGRHPKESRKSHCVMVRFDNEEWQKFLAMYEKSGVYARAVFLKAHFFGQPFRVLVTDRTLLDYCTKLSAFHAQYRMVGNNYNQTQGASLPFLGKEGDGIALPSGKMHGGTGRLDAAGRGTFKGV